MTAFLVVIAFLFFAIALNELVRPYFLRWERRCALLERHFYENKRNEAKTQVDWVFWSKEIDGWKQRHRRRLGATFVDEAR